MQFMLDHHIKLEMRNLLLVSYRKKFDYLRNKEKYEMRMMIHLLPKSHIISIPYKQWRSQDLILGGAVKNNLRGSERGGRVREWGVPRSTVRAFCILMLLMVQFGAYARYFPRIARIYIILL